MDYFIGIVRNNHGKSSPNYYTKKTCRLKQKNKKRGGGEETTHATKKFWHKITTTDKCKYSCMNLYTGKAAEFKFIKHLSLCQALCYFIPFPPYNNRIKKIFIPFFTE